MHDWWEYVNHPGQSPMADLRRKNGQDAPFNVRFWGIGNEAGAAAATCAPSTTPTSSSGTPRFLPRYGAVRAVPHRGRARPTTTTTGRKS